MFFGFNLNEILTFPFKDADSRKHLLMGALVSISAFIIPILPFFVLTGYAAQIARQVLRGESPRMVAWEDWGKLFSDGAKVFGVRLVASIPILIFAIPLMIAGIAMPIATSSAGSNEVEAAMSIFMVVMSCSLCIIIPFSLALAVILPAAEMHVIENNEFAAGFRFREWWQILCINLAGFLAAFGIYYLLTLALTFGIQILMVTVVLACLLPIIMPGITIYSMVIMYAATAQAYRDGKAKLSQPETAA